MSYGPSNLDMSRRSATYVDKILKGAKPADLPVEQPTKFGAAITDEVRGALARSPQESGKTTRAPV